MAYGTMMAWQRALEVVGGAGAHLFRDLQELFVLHALFGSRFACDLYDERDRPLHLDHGGAIFIWEPLAFFFEIEPIVFGRYHALHLHAACEGRRGVERHCASTTFAHLGKFPSFLLLAHRKLLHRTFVRARCFCVGKAFGAARAKFPKPSV